ncbi:hypothetical protein KBD61_04735 [Patescibacteria group bacterium]|nr:hypothetical protein [Patescibacteria group bacterium]MBP9710296.1 hypothetical protein [Patescibacteria group bacterium]
MSIEEAQAGLVRALAFHEAWGYAPTEVELVASWDGGMVFPGSKPEFGLVWQGLQALIQKEKVFCQRGRVFFAGREMLVQEHERREVLFTRKIRRARRVARWLACLGGVRFVALCNTTALAHAREMGDLDFFIVTRAHSLWQTRGLAALPFKLLGLRPTFEMGEERDAVCLSFFIDDSALELNTLQLTQDDPYFRHWFLSLLPLVDDGIGQQLWEANTAILKRHPLSSMWMVHPELGISLPLIRFPFLSALEERAKRAQMNVLPKGIKERANRATDVVVNDHVLKLHATDNRGVFRETYYAICQRHGVTP